MKKSELEYLTNSLKKSLSDMSYGEILGDSPAKLSKFRNLLSLTGKELPEHRVFIESAWHRCDSMDEDDAKEICDYILELLKLNSRREDKIDEGKIFQGAEDKLKEAGVSFSKSDSTSVINNLNTCIELALKDKLDIPITITKINTNKIIEICIAHEVGPVEYLKEIKKHVLEIANRVKHSGYSPSKKDCIDAIKATEDFLKKTKEYSFKVTGKIKEKIYSGV